MDKRKKKIYIYIHEAFTYLRFCYRPSKELPEKENLVTGKQT